MWVKRLCWCGTTICSHSHRSSSTLNIAFLLTIQLTSLKMGVIVIVIVWRCVLLSLQLCDVVCYCHCDCVTLCVIAIVIVWRCVLLPLWLCDVCYCHCNCVTCVIVIVIMWRCVLLSLQLCDVACYCDCDCVMFLSMTTRSCIET